MFPRCRLALLALLALPALADHDAPSLRLLHRLLAPAIDADDTPWRPRASLALPSGAPTAHLAPAPALQADLLEFAEAARGEPGALYQLALERPSDRDPLHWDISTVRACHLLESSTEEISVHVAADRTPFALDYFVGPVPHDGSCPKPRKSKSTSTGKKASTDQDQDQAAAFVQHMLDNTAVAVVKPRAPPLPLLRNAPTLSPDGKTLEAPPEKTFLQKYWMYFAIALAMMMLAPAGEEEKGGAKR